MMGRKRASLTLIFYRKDKYDLVDSGTFWLSETPELPSLGWNGGCNRLCTWVNPARKSYRLHLCACEHAS